MRLRFHPAALIELDEAVDYIEGERDGFGALLFPSFPVASKRGFDRRLRPAT